MDALEWCEQNNIEPDDLDEIVHEAASSMASNSNNEGVPGQLEFLKIIAGWSDEDIIDTLFQLIVEPNRS